ncbi:hypothetical protein N431DRAFT_437671 [Stipitochalara longipes BDJ]|nr:hypothetical protein N431DRAFT_437671 [Stipitochalara longipes BDJ]
MSEQAATDEAATKDQGETPYLADNHEAATEDPQPANELVTEDGKSSKFDEVGRISPRSPTHGTEINETGGELATPPQIQANTPPELDGKGKQQVISQDIIDPALLEENNGTLKHLANNNPTPSNSDVTGKQKSIPISQSQTSHQPPQIPSRTSSSQPSQSASASASNPQSSASQPSAIDQPHIPAKLHYLPLYSTRATGSLSYVGLSATVYTVLFLREAGERDGRRAFERVGVGKVIERGFFGNAKTETVVLV